MTDKKFLFTKAALDKLPSPTTDQAGTAGYVMYWDIKDTGFGLQVRPSGLKTFILVYRNHAGRTRRLTIGRFGRFTVEQARAAIKVYNSRIVLGGDPAEEKDRARETPTFGEVYAAYLNEHIIPGGVKETERSVRRAEALIPRAFMRKLITEIRRADVHLILKPYEQRPGNYNLVRSYIGSAWSWGRKYDRIPETLLSPVMEIETKRSVSQARRVSEAEYRSVHKAIAELMSERRNDPSRLLACCFVIYTGCRPVEAVRLKREHVYRARGVIELREHKTFRRTAMPKVFHLTEPVIDLINRAEALHKLRAVECPYVFPRRGNQKASNWLAKTWKTVCSRADVDIDLRQFRSGYINTLDDMGYSETEVAEITQHMSLSTIRRHYRVIAEKRAEKNARRAALRLASFATEDQEGEAAA